MLHPWPHSLLPLLPPPARPTPKPRPFGRVKESEGAPAIARRPLPAGSRAASAPPLPRPYLAALRFMPSRIPPCNAFPKKKIALPCRAPPAGGVSATSIHLPPSVLLRRSALPYWTWPTFLAILGRSSHPAWRSSGSPSLKPLPRKASSGSPRTGWRADSPAFLPRLPGIRRAQHIPRWRR